MGRGPPTLPARGAVPGFLKQLRRFFARGAQGESRGEEWTWPSHGHPKMLIAWYDQIKARLAAATLLDSSLKTRLAD